MTLPVLFPTPQQIKTDADKRLLLVEGQRVRCSIVISSQGPPADETAAQLIRKAVGARSGAWPCVVRDQPLPGTIPIWIGEAARPVLEDEAAPPAGQDEGYRLQISATGVALRGVGNAGTFYAAQTLTQLLRLSDSELTLPHLSICDWPHFARRGLYVESKWGPDLMTLRDWQELIDHMASLKMNLLGVGIYGCWNIQYDQVPTEFMMVPLKQYPDLQTPKTITYYSSNTDSWQELNYLPPMFVEDFFGEVVAYGKERHVIVRPHFNSLGHNTLIPRLYPQIAAKDAAGWPGGYGFCLSNPETLFTMKRILTEITERYLLPHGVDHFHLGLDEIGPMIGVHPHDPHRRVSPWCQCEECKSLHREELLTAYILELLLILKAAGMKHITLWHDQLEKMGLLNEAFRQMLIDHDLDRLVIINWWTYGVTPFASIRPELGLRRFVTPMTGYYFWSPYRSNLLNIENLCKVGAEQGAEGLEAYCTHDKAFDNQQRLLADCGWHPQAVEDVAGWQEKYARYVFGHAWQSGLDALRAFDQISTPGSHLDLIWQLAPYRYTYVAADKEYPRRYPQEAMQLLRADEQAAEKLAAAIAAAAAARMKLTDLLHAGLPHFALVTPLVAEAWRSEGLARIFEHLLNMQTSYLQAQQKQGLGQDEEALAALQFAYGQVNRAVQLQERVAIELEQTKDHYLLPQTLREWSTIRPFLLETRTFLGAQLDSIAEQRLPDLDI